MLIEPLIDTIPPQPAPAEPKVQSPPARREGFSRERARHFRAEAGLQPASGAGRAFVRDRFPVPNGPRPSDLYALRAILPPVASLPGGNRPISVICARPGVPSGTPNASRSVPSACASNESMIVSTVGPTTISANRSGRGSPGALLMNTHFRNDSPKAGSAPSNTSWAR